MDQPNILLDSLYLYYDEKKITEMSKAIKGDSKISLRIIDWFVTNYSKKYNVYYCLYKTPNGKLTLNEKDNEYIKQVNIYISYKSQLKSFSKKRFDPFCRRERIKFQANNSVLETTIGQLNFFKWAIDNLVIDYIKHNYKDIEEDMNTSYNRQNKKKGEKKQRKQRQELSKSATRGLNTKAGRVYLSFD
jgi:hypothetical protein